MSELLYQKIQNIDYAKMIEKHAVIFSAAEQNLLDEILQKFEFDPAQAQALVEAVRQQSTFNPDALHYESEDDEDVTGICLHCINPPIPPLRDYFIWREKQQTQSQNPTLNLLNPLS